MLWKQRECKGQCEFADKKNRQGEAGLKEDPQATGKGALQALVKPGAKYKQSGKRVHQWIRKVADAP